MSSNRYDREAQYNPIDTYIPIPFTEISAAAQYRQKKLEGMEDRMDMAAEQAKMLNYIPGSADEGYIKEINSNIAKISAKYMGQDLSNPIIARQLKQEMRTGVDVNKVKDIQDSYTNWMQNQKMNSELKAKGLYRSELDENPAIGYDTSTKGVYTYQTSAFENYLPLAKQYFNDIKASIKINPKTGSPYETPEGYNINAISPEKIQEVARNNVSSFLDTNAGKQAVTLAMKRDPNLADKDPEAIALRILEDTGKQFIFETLTGSRRPQDRDGAFKKLLAGLPEINQNLNTSSTLPNIKVSAVSNINMDYFTETGGEFNAINQFADQSSPWSTHWANKLDTDIYKNEGIKTRPRLQELKKKVGAEKMADEPFIKKYNNAGKASMNQNIGVINVPSDGAKKTLQHIKDNRSNVSFVMGTGEGFDNDGQDQTFNGLAKALKIDVVKLEAQLKDKETLGFTQQGPSAGMFVTSFRNSKGNDIPVLIGDVYKEVSKMTDSSHKLWQNFVNLREDPVFVGTDPDNKNAAVYGRIVPKLDPNYDLFEDTIEYGTMEDEKFVSNGKKERLNSFQNTTLNKVMNSGFIGTDFPRVNMGPNTQPSNSPSPDILKLMYLMSGGYGDSE